MGLSIIIKDLTPVFFLNAGETAAPLHWREDEESSTLTNDCWGEVEDKIFQLAETDLF
jgi:hypothetical protein